jgi:proline iminopeptidase
MRRYFDPNAYRIVLFDQRGCGRSRPHASDPAVDLSTNTTHHLIADLEQLRLQLDIDSWLVFGGSWGSTLALAYAERHQERVTELIIFSVGTTRRREVEWMTRHVGRLFPEQWGRFRDGVPPAERDGNLAEAYRRLLGDPDPAVREKAASDWCDWETTHVEVRPGAPRDPRFEEPRFRMCFARLVTHYWSHAAWLDDGVLLDEIDRLDGVPGVLVHGRLDVSSPLDIPWELSQAWRTSEFVIVDEAAHSFAHPGMAAALVAATNRFARSHGP